MEKTKAIKNAYQMAQKEVKNIVVNEITDLVAGSTGFLILGETPEEEFGITAGGEAYLEVRMLITAPNGETLLATDKGLVRFGDISTDEAVELHDLIFDRLMPRITKEVVERFGAELPETLLETVFGGCPECNGTPKLPVPAGLMEGMCNN